MKGAKLLICITIYNEPFSQVLESLSGLYRAYYELLESDASYLEKVSICIIADGYDRLKTPFLEACAKAGIYDEKYTQEAFNHEQQEVPGFDKSTTLEQDDKKIFYTTNFYNDETSHLYGSNNIGHTFSRNLTFEDWIQGVPAAKRQRMHVNNLSIDKFIYGSAKRGGAANFIYGPKPILCNLIIKHSNKGKIESHLWFFKGMCQYLNPDFAQIIDAGTVPLRKSVS
jgi:chitin synthase